MIRFSFWKWVQFWGEAPILVYLFFGICALLLLLFSMKQKPARLLLGIEAGGIVLFFLPPAIRIFRTVLGKNVYWRVLWIVPLIPAAAYALSLLVTSCRYKVLKVLVGAAAAAFIILTGVNAFSDKNFQTMENLEKVPQEVVSICEQIHAIAPDQEVMLATDDYLASYIRVYDASIKMLYGRSKHEAVSNGAKRIYGYINTWPNTNYTRLRRRLKLEGVDFLVMRKPSEEGRRILAGGGYRRVGRAGKYRIFASRAIREGQTG